MPKFEELQADLAALSSTLGVLDKEFQDAGVSEIFYFKKRRALIREQEVALRELQTILDGHDAGEMSSVIEKVATGSKDEEIESELESAAAAGESKGWGQIVKDAISERKGSILDLAISAALKVAKLLI